MRPLEIEGGKAVPLEPQKLWRDIVFCLWRQNPPSVWPFMGLGGTHNGIFFQKGNFCLGRFYGEGVNRV